MQVVSFPARQARTHYRHELRSLTYVTLNTANGGIIRNLNSQGVAVQAVAPLHQHERVRLRFELRFPRLRVETYGQVQWATPAGQCGIRFIDLPSRSSHAISEWIFSNLLDSLARERSHHSIFRDSRDPVIQGEASGEDFSGYSDGLILSARPRPSILPEKISVRLEEAKHFPEPQQELARPGCDPEAELNWLSQPLSGRTLAWLVDGLVMVAALLLFTLIFLAITHELPVWPVTLGAITAAVIFVAGAYWVLFNLFGGASLGNRLIRATSSREEEETREASRFR
jgi:RDD family/PilZ domain